MKVSLVLATVGRFAEVEKFLTQLALQTYKDFELILVDQNEDDRLVPLYHRYSEWFPFVHLRSAKGLSKARNAGLKKVTGQIISFPDDDCWYDADVLEKAVALFEAHPDIDVITGRSVDEAGGDTNFKFDTSPGSVDKHNVWRRAISFTIFLRQPVADSVGGFDEEMGVGASTIYLSGEETDYVLRAMAQHAVYYDPAFTVHHPDPLQVYTPHMIKRAYKYGCGFGKVLSKHRYPMPFKLKMLARPFLGMLLFFSAFQFPKSHYYWNSFKGRLRGML